MACSTSSVLLRRVRALLGEEAVQEVLSRAGVPQPASYFDDIGNWMPYADSLALFAAAVEVTGDDRLAQRVGEHTVRQHAGTPVATLFRSLGSPEAVYEQLSIGVSKFTTVTELHPERVSAGRATLRAQARPGHHRDRNMCLLMLGMLSQPTVLFGLPPASVAHPECELRGAPHCRYEVSWDAGQAADATDPEKVLVALEAQLAAMGDRLDSMYATARDLIALSDLDGALERITHRAATAVRAPSYLLAVRTDEDSEPRIHQRGLEPEQAAAEARALLDGGGTRSDGSRLVADIASETRHYGRIVAASPSESFFPHERDVLEIYGRYAAAVLDTHTALAAARDNERQSRALLQLAQALAAAPSSPEVAQRLVDATPAVVDCDRVSVFLWHEDEGVLRFEAGTAEGGVRERVARLQIRPSDTPVLERLLAGRRPEPVLVTSESTDPFLGGVMRQTAVAAMLVVPIVAQGRFYGAMTVSVTERPDRLRRAGLGESLAGVVALAATAFDNARLIEAIAHQASHDNLTGLLGHRAFHEAIGAPREEPVTLAMIDLDDFKAINDTYGHPAGDAALRLVAEALRGAVREGDAVFRVGGEEFAVLLAGLTGAEARPVADRLRLAVAAAPFRVPLRISVGLASGAHGELVDRADAALYAAKRAGKDRVAVA